MSQKMNQGNNAETSDSRWKGLYKVGGAAALSAVVVVLVEAIVISTTIGIQPITTIDWFTLFQNNRLLGLIDHALLDIAVITLLGPMFLALYAALRRANETYLTVATPIAFAGIAAYVATNTSFNMLFLSDQYAAATTDAQRSMILAAGQAISAIDQYGMFWSMGFILVTVASLIIAVVMLRSNIFSKVTAYVGILASVLVLANYISFAFVPATFVVPTIFAMGGWLLMMIWWSLVGRRLFQLGRGVSKEEVN